MKPDEAIKIKVNHQRLHPDVYYHEFLQADNLSIEALKWRRRCEQAVEPDTHPLLPGETK